MWNDIKVRSIFQPHQGLTTETEGIMVLVVMLLSQSLMKTFLNENKIKDPWEDFLPPF
jgi:hypothetical protein